MKAVIEKFIAACNEGDERQAWALLTPTTVITVAGSTWFSGRFEGEEQIRRILLATVQEYLHATHIKLLEIIAENAYVAALIEVSGNTRKGTPFLRAGSPWGVCFTLDDQRIVSVELFPDTMFVETTLCGATYQPNDPAQVLS